MAKPHLRTDLDTRTIYAYGEIGASESINARAAKSGQGDNGTLNNPKGVNIIAPKHSAWLKAYNAPRQKQAAKIAAWSAEHEVKKVATQIIHADRMFNLKYQGN